MPCNVICCDSQLKAPALLTRGRSRGLLIFLYPMRDHASVRLPGVLHTNVGNSNFRYVLFSKNISSDITAFEQGTLASLLVEHIGNVTGFLDDFNRWKEFWPFFSQQGTCA